MSFPHCPHCRKNGGYGLPHTCRCLDKDLLFRRYGMVDTTDHLPLPISVRKWKFKILHGVIPQLFPLKLIRNPFVVTVKKFLIPVF